MSHVTCHVSGVTCHMSCVTCHMSCVTLGRINFCHKQPNMSAESFIVSFGALISHKKFQHDSSTPS